MLSRGAVSSSKNLDTAVSSEGNIALEQCSVGLVSMA